MKRPYLIALAIVTAVLLGLSAVNGVKSPAGHNLFLEAFGH